MKFLLVLLTLLTITPSYAGTLIYVQSSDKNTLDGSLGGSGFIIANTAISSIGITNYHVCVSNYDGVVYKNARPSYAEIVVKFNKLAKRARILMADKYTDLCALEIVGVYPRFKFSKYPELHKGDKLRALNSVINKTYNLFYLGVDRNSDQWTTFHKGSLFAHGFTPKGTSGAPVVDSTGRLVGVLWGHDNNRNNSYFTSLYRLQIFLKALEKVTRIHYN